MRKLLVAERNALLPIIRQDWDDEDELMRHIAVALDNASVARTTYVGVMQFGTEDGKVFYVGIGPFSGKRSAENALTTHPGAAEAHRCAVVPLTSPTGLDALLKKVG